MSSAADRDVHNDESARQEFVKVPILTIPGTTTAVTGRQAPGGEDHMTADERADPHYFDDDPTVPSERRPIEVTLPDVAFTMHTDSGVFSHGRLDTGTAVLLRSVPAPPDHGHLLDLGCGAGPIALTMALRSPNACVWAVDVNQRARQLCSANALDLELANLRVAAPDEVPDDVRFEAIWSNPPIRVGKAALHGLLQHWLARLAVDGDAWLVVQRHLGADSLQRWLTNLGYPTERMASRAGFRVLRITSATKGGQITTSE